MKHRRNLETTALEVHGEDGFRQDVQVGKSVESSASTVDGILELLDPSLLVLVKVQNNPAERREFL